MNETELIEAMARAIGAAYERGDPKSDVDLCNLDYDAAKAALSAILKDHVIVPREPTEAMLEAGCDIGPIGCCNMSTDDAYECYRAMIQAGKIGGE